jgi:pimeloyl-ACP methyl ester carboxylesterase
MKIYRLFFIALLLSSCSKFIKPKVKFTESTLMVQNYILTTFSTHASKDYLIVFESGLGDDHTVWQKKKVADKASEWADILLYDRAGYGASSVPDNERTISALSSDLHEVINAHRNNRKIILVAHSLGGMIVRDYAIKYPEEVDALLFVDASHELYNNPDQAQVDVIKNAFSQSYGENFGGTLEAKELKTDSEYMATLPNLPNVLTVALISMKIDKDHDAADRKLWYNSKVALGNGLSDYQLITTEKSGHYILLEEPDLVVNNLNMLISRLP